MEMRRPKKLTGEYHCCVKEEDSNELNCCRQLK